METDISPNDTAPIQPESGNQERVKEVHHHHYHERRGFNFGRLFLGLIIILLGLVFLAQESGWLNIGYNFDWALVWPVLIVFLGLSMLSGRGWASNLVGIVVTIAVLAIIALMIFGGTAITGLETKTEVIAVERDAAASAAEISIKNGAGSIKIAGGADVLASGTWESNFLTPVIKSSVESTVQKVALTAEGNWRGFGRHFNNLDLRLDDSLPTRLEIDTGAVSLDADLSTMVVEALKIQTGASSINLTLGDRATSSSLILRAGASSIDITLPKTVGVKLKLSSGLSSKTLVDFRQVGEHEYQSSNYDEAAKKIEMDLELGVSSLDIGWR